MMQRLSLEVLLERPFSHIVVLERDVAVGGEGSGEDGDVAEDGLEGLVKDVCFGEREQRLAKREQDGGEGKREKRKGVLDILYSVRG